MKKYSLEFKMKIVAEYLTGTISLKSLANKYEIKSTYQLRQWLNAYKTLGIEGLKRSRKNKSYDVEFKLKAITIYESSEKSYQEVANELGLNNPSLIATWRKTYHEQGIGGLSQKQGRPSMSKNSSKKAKDISDKKISEASSLDILNDLDLANKRIEELEYELKMQKIKNEYLELLRSLRQEKRMKTRQESSTNSEDKKNTP